MPAFLIAQVKVTDDAWIPDYAAKVHDLVAAHGGKYLSRSAAVETLEGQDFDGTIVALIEFPDKAAAKAFAASEAYAPFAKARRDGSESRFLLVDDTDVAGAIPYLAKG